MNQSQLTNLLLDQSKDLIWIVNSNFQLVYANTIYQSLMKEMTDAERKLNESVFIEAFGEEDTEKWKAYYNRAFKDEYFEIEEQYFNPKTNEINYSQTTFKPIIGDDAIIFAISCQSRNITRLVKQRSEANQLMDASLDVFCTISEKGEFLYVSAASEVHWGYKPEEVIGKPYVDFILEEDVPKTNDIAADILSGQEIKTFVNRYKKKDGSIAYNLWSARWDDTAKLMYCVARDGKERIEQEEKILQSEQRFKALVQDGYDLMTITDIEGNYIYVSPSSTVITGFTPEEFMGRNAFEFIHPDDAERALTSLKKLATQTKIVLEPFRTKNKNNQWRWAETVLTNMLNIPAVNGIVANTRDITERIEQEKKIALSEQRFKALVQDGSDLIGIIDAEGNYIYVSPTSTAVLGIAPEEFIGKSAFDFIHPDDADRTLISLQKITTENRIMVEPFRIKNNKNEWRWIETVLMNMLDNPVIKGIVANSRDITDKIEEQKTLKLLESVITNTNDAILITEAEPFDEPGPKIIYVNEAFTKMTGYTAEEVIGKSPRILQGPNSNKVELAKLGQSLKNWESHEITTVNYKKSGEEFWVNFTVTPVVDEKGWYTHWIAIERDVTDKKIKELESNLINNIVKIFNQSGENELTECLTKLCEEITQFGNFDYAELWLTAIDGKTINRITNYVESTIGSEFYNATESIKSHHIGEGILGYVWENKTTEIFENIEEKYLNEIKDAIKKAGIKTIIGVPLIHKEEVIAVLVLGTEKTRPTLLKYSKLFKKLESVIGAELSRKKIEIELAQIFNFSPDMICMAGFDGYLKRINPAGLELLGYSLEEMLSRPIKSFIHEDDRLLTIEKQQGLYGGKNLKNYENRYITKQGKIIWLSWTADSIVEQKIIHAVAKNVTEEKKLRELNRQTSSLAKIGSWEVDLANQKMYWSEEVHKMHETDSNSFLPNMEESMNFYREDFRQIVYSNFEKSIITGEPFDFEAVLVTAKKKEVWVRAIGNAEFVDGTCVRIYGSFQDINDRKEAEVRLQSLADNLPGVVFQYLIYPDGTDNLKYVTKASKAVWGFTAEEVLENNQLVWNRIIAGGEIDKVKKSIAEAVESKTKWTGRWKYVMPNGEIRIHLGYGTPNFLADGTILFNSVILDITQEAENEELLEEITKLAKIGSWEINLIQNQTKWSAMVHNIMETNPEQFLPDRETNINFFREDFRNIVTSQLENCAEKGIPVDFEAVIVTANKNEKWVRVIGSAEIVEGKKNRLYGSFQDINDRKEAEEKLIESEQKYRQIAFELELQQLHLTNAQEVAKVGSWETDLQSLKIIWSDETYRIFGLDQKTFELTHENFLACVHPEDRDHVDKAFVDSASDTLSSKNFIEHRIITPSGEVKVVEELWKITYNEKGKPLLAIGSCQDITERKKAQTLLLESENKFRSLIENSSDMLTLITADGMMEYISPSVEKTFGYTNEENKIRQAMEVVHPDDAHLAAQTIESAFKNPGVPFTSTIRNRKKDGTYIWVEGTVTNMLHVPGVNAIVANIRDITERKKAEEQQVLFSSIVNTSYDGILSYSLDSVIYSWNAGAEKILGYTAAEIIGKTVYEFIPSAFKHEEVEILGKIKNGEFIDSYETERIKKNGERIFVSITVSPIKDSTGNVVGASKIIRDITERKKAAEEKNNLLATIENSLNEIYLFDAETFLFSYVNKGALNNLGYSEQEIKQLTPLDLKPDFTESSFKKLVSPLVNNEQEKIVFFTNHLRKAGSLYPVEVHLQLVKEGNTKIFLAVILDITERKKAAEIILQSNERFEKVTEATNDAIWDWDMVNHTYYRSKAIERFFGKAALKAFTENAFWKDNFHPEDLPLIKTSLNEAINDPLCTNWKLEYRVINENRKTLYVIDRGVIVRNKEGKAIRMVGAMTDISEQKQLELESKDLNQVLQQNALELKRSNEELEQFAFVASHDLQEPLRMVSSFMDQLERKYGSQLDEKAHQYIYFATDGAKRMKQIILDLLEYSRASRPTEGKEEVDLNEVFSEYNQLRRKIISEKTATITSIKLPILNTYKAVITQIFHCLLDNALKYSIEERSPIIKINAAENEKEWVFSIKDNGIGIDSQFYDKIFVIFQRLHNKEEYAGTGIGLSIAKRHAEFLGGQIWLESKLGEGSVFYFTISKTK